MKNVTDIIGLRDIGSSWTPGGWEFLLKIAFNLGVTSRLMLNGEYVHQLLPKMGGGTVNPEPWLPLSKLTQVLSIQIIPKADLTSVIFSTQLNLPHELFFAIKSGLRRVNQPSTPHRVVSFVGGVAQVQEDNAGQRSEPQKIRGRF